MGDIIALLPLLKALNEGGWKVAVLAKKEWLELVPQEHYHTWISSTLPWASYSDSKKYSSLHRLWTQINTIKRSLETFASGAIGIDPRGDLRSIILLYLLGCRDVASMGRYTGSSLSVPSLAAVRAHPNVVEKRWSEILSLLPCLGLPMPSAPEPPRIISRDVHASTPDEVIVLIPIAPWSGKHWAPAHWRFVISRLRSRDRTLVALCGPGQTSDVVRMLGEEEHVVECPSIKEWVERLSCAVLVVTVDTGPMHLAAALGIPTVSLFGVTPLPLWAPSGEHTLIVHPQSEPAFQLCQQVEANIEPGKHWMERVSQNEVLEACESILGSPSKFHK